MVSTRQSPTAGQVLGHQWQPVSMFYNTEMKMEKINETKLRKGTVENIRGKILGAQK